MISDISSLIICSLSPTALEWGAQSIISVLKRSLKMLNYDTGQTQAIRGFITYAFASCST